MQILENHHHADIDLLIIDCIAAIVSPVIGGKINNKSSRNVIYSLSNALKNLCRDSLAIVLTNSTVSGDHPALGRYWR